MPKPFPYSCIQLHDLNLMHVYGSGKGYTTNPSIMPLRSFGTTRSYSNDLPTAVTHGHKDKEQHTPPSLLRRLVLMFLGLGLQSVVGIHVLTIAPKP